ncbi:hypothetical protein ILUMI_10678, partial [Ignelater luminosus]
MYFSPLTSSTSTDISARRSWLLRRIYRPNEAGQAASPDISATEGTGEGFVYSLCDLLYPLSHSSCVFVSSFTIASHKRTGKTTAEKLDILKRFDELPANISQRDTAGRLGIARTTLADLLKQRTTLSVHVDANLHDILRDKFVSGLRGGPTLDGMYEEEQKQTVTLDNIVLPEENLPELEIVTEPVAESNKELLSGNRIVDIDFFLQETKKLHLHDLRCTMGKMQFQKEIREGFTSVLYYYCDTCNKSITLGTRPQKANVNNAFVWGTTSIGIGYSQSDELFSVLNVPIMTPRKRQYRIEYQRLHPKKKRKVHQDPINTINVDYGPNSAKEGMPETEMYVKREEILARLAESAIRGIQLL